MQLVVVPAEDQDGPQGAHGQSRLEDLGGGRAAAAPEEEGSRYAEHEHGPVLVPGGALDREDVLPEDGPQGAQDGEVQGVVEVGEGLGGLCHVHVALEVCVLLGLHGGDGREGEQEDHGDGDVPHAEAGEREEGACAPYVNGGDHNLLLALVGELRVPAPAVHVLDVAHDEGDHVVDDHEEDVEGAGEDAADGHEDRLLVHARRLIEGAEDSHQRHGRREGEHPQRGGHCSRAGGLTAFYAPPAISGMHHTAARGRGLSGRRWVVLACST